MRIVFTNFLFVLLFQVAATSLIFGQAPEGIKPILGEKTAPFRVEKIGVVDFSAPNTGYEANMWNTHKIIPEGADPGRDEFRKIKAEANRLSDLASNPNPSSSTMKTAAGEPTVVGTIFGNTFDGIPNDNTIASGRNGQIICGTNSKFGIYSTSTGFNITTKTMGALFSSSAIKYDPKVTFDRDWDRYIIVFLVGDSPNSSKVIVCFSQTDNAAGLYNIYAIPGNANPGVVGPCWSDFPQIGLSNRELFITTNLFDDNDLYKAGYIFQIDKKAGYLGDANLPVAGYGGSGSTYFAISPAEGNSVLYGPKMYMVSTRGGSGGSSNSVYLHVISDSMNATPAPVLQTFPINATSNYAVAPDAAQKGSVRKLDTRDTRVRCSFYENERIHFGMNCAVSSKPGIFIGTLAGITNPAFAAATGVLYKPDSFEIAYPGLAYGGRTSTNGVNSILMFFDMASVNHYPGTAVMHIDTNGIISNPVVCKYGASFIEMSGPDTCRWGDYSDTSPIPDNPGEIWAAGYYGYGSGRHGTYMSHIYGPNIGTINKEPEIVTPKMNVEVYPNPSITSVKIRFDVPKTGIYKVSISTIEGKKIQTILEDKLTMGTAEAIFETEPLSSGSYIVTVENDQGEVFSQKFLVTK